MPVKDEKKPFTELMLEAIPQRKGVYVLWDRRQIVYVGVGADAGGLYSALTEHLRGERVPEARRIRDFQIEVCSHPVSRQTELIEEHRAAHGSLPAFNEPT